MKGKVLLIGAEDEENLAIRYLGSVLVQDGYIVEISPCSKYQDINRVTKDIKKFKPNLIAISIAFQSLANMFFDLVKAIKKINPQIHITVGGHFPTFEYKKILETQRGIDSIVRFEGETPIIQLAKAVTSKSDLSEVSNLVYRKNDAIMENPCIHRFPDLDNLPFPIRGRSMHVRLGERFATIAASRGCFHSSCLYCCIGAFHSKKEDRRYALRSPENIAKEISELYHKHEVSLFQFHDDNFMLPSKEETVIRLHKLNEALKNEAVELSKVSFLIKARPDSINKEVADALKELGVIGIFLGVENACNSGLKSLIRGATVEDIENALRILKDYQMAVTFNLLIFHPNATLDEINQNIYFIKNHLEYPLDFGRAEIVAGSPLERQVISEKILRGNWPNWDYKIKDDSVERLFQINKLTFRKKGSNYSQLVHSLIALSYHVYLINKIYPGPSAQELLKEYNTLTLKSNKFILQKILEMYQLATEVLSENDLNNLYNSIKDGCSNLLNEVNRLSNKINKLQILEKTFNKFKISDPVQKIRPVVKIFRI